MLTEKKVSLIVPVYYEEECIQQFLKETIHVLESEKINYEIVFTDDGSTDNTVALIREAALLNDRIKLIEFSYNHGKQAALTASISYATGDYLLMMDPDLQDPPTEIPRFISKIEEGYDLIFGVRKEKKDSFINRLLSATFWWILERFTGLNIPKGLAVMRIFNRRFANQFLKYNEASRFIEGMFIHIGMKRSEIEIDQRERFAGRSKFNFNKKLQLAFDAILDFSDLPLRTVLRIGSYLIFLGFLALLTIVISRVFFVEYQLGWPSVMATLLLGFGFQLMFMGVIGLYVGKIYKETKQRPLYSVKELTNISPK